MKSLKLIIIFLLSLIFSGPVSAQRSGGHQVETKTVSISLFSFRPELLVVRPGTKVVWINRDKIEHSITEGEPGENGRLFDSGFFTEGERFEFVFFKPGDYHFFCKRHNSMKGMVRVISGNDDN